MQSHTISKIISKIFNFTQYFLKTNLKISVKLCIYSADILARGLLRIGEWVLSQTDLEKAASSASNACGHFVGNHSILRTFWVKYPVLLTEDGGRRVEDGEFGLDQGDLSKEDGELSI